MNRMKAAEFRDEFLKVAEEATTGGLSESSMVKQCRDMLRLLCQERLRKLEEAEEA